MFATLRQRKWAGPVSAVLLALGAAGCGGERGQVSGQVRYAGRPLAGGTVVLLASDGTSYRADLDDDGRFRIDGVAQGEARLGVSSLAEVAGPATGPGAVSGRVARPAAVRSRIPARYGDLGRSGLSVHVEKDSTVELDLN